MPVVTGRFVSLNGKTLDQLKDQHFPRRMLENAELSWADTPPDRRQNHARQVVDRLRMRTRSPSAKARRSACTSALVPRSSWKSAARRCTLKVGGDLSGRMASILRAGVVRSAFRACSKTNRHLVRRRARRAETGAQRWSGHCSRPIPPLPSSTSPMCGAHRERRRSDYVCGPLSCRIFDPRGLMILASSIASTRFRRMREAVVLKTLGATRMRIVRTFSVEFSVLGLLAGLGRRGLCQHAHARAAAQA